MFATATKQGLVKQFTGMLQNGLDNVWLSFLMWATSTLVGGTQDEAQILDNFVTQMAQEVEAGKTYAQAFADAKATLVAAELTEWQSLQLNAIEEAANIMDSLVKLLQGTGL